MAIRSDDITTIIRSAIDQFDAGVETRSVGTVVEVGDGIATIYGLAGALASELIEFPDGVMGMALNLEEETVGAVILGDYADARAIASARPCRRRATGCSPGRSRRRPDRSAKHREAGGGGRAPAGAGRGSLARGQRDQPSELDGLMRAVHLFHDLDPSCRRLMTREKCASVGAGAKSDCCCLHKVC